ncbi:MAG: glycosyl transferase [Abditibacteriota bacterium]|nr:glycosyl transferase [Abditibacteriota bacterium]
MNIINTLKAVKKTIKEKKKYFIKNYIKNKGYIPDKIYIPKYYKEHYGKVLNITHPKTIAEKNQWMKLYYRDPLFVLMSDKYRNRFYIEKVTGKDYSVPLLGVWKKFEDIDFSSLPKSFVLKTNHDNHPIFVLDKDSADFEAIKRQIYEKLRISKYYKTREWGYKNIKRCVFAEELLGDGIHEFLDYKFFCFNGKVKYLYVFTDSTDGKNGKMTFFDRDFNRMPIKLYKCRTTNKNISKPENFEEMISLAEELAKDIPFVRVDMFNVEGRIYVGEFTFYPSNGFLSYKPEEYDEIIGSYLTLPEKNGWKKLKNRDKQWLKKSLM